MLSDFEPVFPAVAGKAFKEKKQALNSLFSVDSNKGAVLVPFLGALYRGCVDGKCA